MQIIKSEKNNVNRLVNNFEQIHKKGPRSSSVQDHKTQYYCVIKM